MDVVVVAIAVVLVLVALNVFSEPDRPAAIEDEEQRRYNKRMAMMSALDVGPFAEHGDSGRGR